MGSSAAKQRESPDAVMRGFRRWRRVRRSVVGGVLAVVGMVVVLDHRGCLLVPRGDDLAVYHGVEARVLRVIDGDTFEIDVPDERQQRPATRVILWGIDCPEPAAPGREAEPLAGEATAFTRALVQDQGVRLRIEPQRTRDALGRLIAHVELLDARSVNEALLERGLARTDERWPHALLLRYAQLEVNARRLERGMWAEHSEQ